LRLLFSGSLCGSRLAFGPTNIFAPASNPAKSILGLSRFVLAVTRAIVLVVFIWLLHSVVKFRKRKIDDGRESPQEYGSNQVELAWTIIPILMWADGLDASEGCPNRIALSIGGHRATPADIPCSWEWIPGKGI
jgi:hypothetical protein